MKGGHFENNRAQDGAVAVVTDSSTIQVEDGVYTGNVAARQGGVLAAYGGAGIQVGSNTLSHHVSMLARSLV